MPIRVAIRHQTTYGYDRPVGLSPHLIRLRPAPHTRTPIADYRLRIQPEPEFINWLQDPFGNYQARVVFTEKVERLVIGVEVVADLIPVNPFDFFLEDYAERVPFAYGEDLRRDLAPYLEIADDGPLLSEWIARPAHRPPPSGESTVGWLVELNRLLAGYVRYHLRMEPGVQSCETTLRERSGSCRDSAWLLVQILRHHGLAARFVSGYLVQLAATDGSGDGPKTDSTDLHAWAEVYLPGAGWIGLDATSGLFAGEQHIPLAATPRPAGAAPVSGSSEPAGVTFEFSNEVERLGEAPARTGY